jgi:hypothetical protein
MEDTTISKREQRKILEEKVKIFISNMESCAKVILLI